MGGRPQTGSSAGFGIPLPRLHQLPLAGCSIVACTIVQSGVFWAVALFGGAAAAVAIVSERASERSR